VAIVQGCKQSHRLCVQIILNQVIQGHSTTGIRTESALYVIPAGGRGRLLVRNSDDNMTGLICSHRRRNVYRNTGDTRWRWHKRRRAMMHGIKGIRALRIGGQSMMVTVAIRVIWYKRLRIVPLNLRSAR